MLPPSPREFKDIYVVFELMETDLHQARPWMFRSVLSTDCTLGLRSVSLPCAPCCLLKIAFKVVPGLSS